MFSSSLFISSVAILCYPVAFCRATCDYLSSPTSDNTIIFSGIDSADLANQKQFFPNDSYLSWMESTRSNYDSSVYIPSTADACQGVGFHWSLNNDPNNYSISIAAAFYLGEGEKGSEGGGFGAIGFSETGGMRGADVVYFTFEDSDPVSTATLTDAHILDSLTKPIPDEQQDWTLVSSSVTDDGYLVLEMTRKLDTSDSFDRAFVNDSNTFVEDHRLIAAWNRSPIVPGDVIYHGQNRARTSIQLFSSDESDAAPGLDYDGFKKEMEERSDLAVDLGLSSFPIPQVETYYHEECFTLSDMISKGLFKTQDSTANVIGYEFIIDPNTVKYMHHIVFYGHYSKDACSVFDRAPIFAWTPGEDFLYFSQGSGFILGGPNRFMSFTMQYHVDNKDKDSGKVDMGSGLRIYTSRKETISVELGMMQIGDPNVQLAGEKIGHGRTKHVFECPSSCTQNNFNVDEVTVIKESLHMHSFGKRIVNQVIRDHEVIHEGFIDYWDFDQSGTPAPQQNPYQVRRGDEFRTLCYYDTVDDTNVEFGIGSYDEMCMAFILYYPKQAVSTCGVNNFHRSCTTKYSGATMLESAADFGRQFGEKKESETETETETGTETETETETETATQTCSDGYFEVSPHSASSVKLRIKPMNATIQVQISVDKNSWLGFGINSEGLMLDSDAIIGSPSGVAKYRLENAKSRSGVRKLEESKQTLLESSFIQDSQSSTMSFTKMLNDGDDALISLEEPTTFIYAVGYNNDLTGHSESGSIKISLGSPCKHSNISSTTTANLYKQRIHVHGVFGIIVFGVLMPIAILSARLRKWLDCALIGSKKTWFVIHTTLMFICFLMVIVVYGLAVQVKNQSKSKHFQGSHEIIGVLVLFLITIQVFLGILRPPQLPSHQTIDNDEDDESLQTKNNEQPSPRRKQWKKAHIILGVATLALGIYQIASGLTKYEALFEHGFL